MFPVALNAQGKQFQINDTLKVRKSLLYKEEFKKNLDDWIVEQQPGGTVSLSDGQLDINDAKGCTIWFAKSISQPMMIEYTATVIDHGGPNDRVSDLNCFWLATDPDRKGFFSNPARKGRFPQYDTLQLYYVGLGGHNNSKTRFRKYSGTGEKPLLPEHDLSDPEFLITPNQPNHIRIVVYDEIIQYWRNNELIYNILDANPYSEGYFGFRTVNNHMKVDNFLIYTLERQEK